MPGGRGARVTFLAVFSPTSVVIVLLFSLQFAPTAACELRTTEPLSLVTSPHPVSLCVWTSDRLATLRLSSWRSHCFVYPPPIYGCEVEVLEVLEVKTSLLTRRCEADTCDR